MYVYSKYLLKMSTQDVYTRCLLKIQNAYVVQQQQSKNTTPKPPIDSTVPSATCLAHNKLCVSVSC